MTDRNERCPGSADKTVPEIRGATRRKFSAEEKIRIVLQGLHGEETIAEPTGHRLEAARTRVRRQGRGRPPHDDAPWPQNNSTASACIV
jgi:transposase-like protein